VIVTVRHAMPLGDGTSGHYWMFYFWKYD